CAQQLYAVAQATTSPVEHRPRQIDTGALCHRETLQHVTGATADLKYTSLRLHRCEVRQHIHAAPLDPAEQGVRTLVVLLDVVAPHHLFVPVDESLLVGLHGVRLHTLLRAALHRRTANGRARRPAAARETDGTGRPVNRCP